MRKRILLAILALMVGIAAPVSGENILVPATGISQSTADGFYVNVTGDDMTGALTVTEAGLPLTVKNNTNSDDLELFKFYHARGAGNGNDGDTMTILYQFDDEIGTTIPMRIVPVMSDANPGAGGTDGRWDFYTNSNTPVLMFTIDGISDSVKCDLYAGLDDAFDSGMRVGDGLIQFETSGTPQFEINEAGGYYRGLGTSAIIDARLAVNTTIGALHGSVLAQFASTTQGTLPAPIMTTAQRTAISPTTGLLVDDSDLNALTRYNGASWDIFSMNIPTTKSGTVAGGSFAGNPKVFTVTFGTAFPDTNYAVSIDGEDNRTLTFQTKLAGSFVINTNANLAIAGTVDWTATAHNDP